MTHFISVLFSVSSQPTDNSPISGALLWSAFRINYALYFVNYVLHNLIKLMNKTNLTFGFPFQSCLWASCFTTTCSGCSRPCPPSSSWTPRWTRACSATDQKLGLWMVPTSQVWTVYWRQIVFILFFNDLRIWNWKRLENNTWDPKINCFDQKIGLWMDLTSQVRKLFEKTVF